MLNGLPPFSSKQGSKELFRKIMSEKVKMPPGSSAAACKVLKGLLNRNAQNRLGAARSTMFEVGGVAALKKMDFFSGLDWDKLVAKQIDPPYTFDKAEDEHDLRHFHNEFTDMPLPRSVFDMSTSDRPARRVDSTAFRGFSFIHDSFTLPSRDSTEIENYWNAQGEEDGESDSETASSKCDFEATAPLEPEKKKRPPRKRKKKNKVDAAAGTTATAASIASSAPPSKIGEADPNVDGPKEQNTKAQQSVEPDDVTQKIDDSQAATTASTPIAQPSTLKDAPAWHPTGTTNTHSGTTVPKKTPNQRPQQTWQTVSTVPKQSTQQPKVQPVAATKRGWGTPQTSALSQPKQAAGTMATPSVVRPVTTAAPTGSWAARIQSQAGTTHAPMPVPRAPPQTPPSMKAIRSSDNSVPTPPSPSSDWRKHKSPQVNRSLMSSRLRSPDKTKATADRVLDNAPPSWPSLSDFPPPGAAKGSGPGVTKAKPMGAWGSRTKS